MMSDTDNLWYSAGRSVSGPAQQLRPWAIAVFAVAAFAYGWEEIGEPLAGALTSKGYYPFSLAIIHIRNNVITSIEAPFLLWGAWELQRLIGKLADGGLWAEGAAQCLTRVGAATILAGAAALIFAPALAALFLERPLDLSMNPVDAAQLGVGVLLVFVARLFQTAVDAARALKRETDQYV